MTIVLRDIEVKNNVSHSFSFFSRLYDIKIEKLVDSSLYNYIIEFCRFI